MPNNEMIWVPKNALTNIGNAIREKLGVETFYKLDEMPSAIDGIGGTVTPLTVIQNGIYTPPSGIDGYSPVTVNVSGGGLSLPSEYQEVEYVSMTGDQYAIMPNLITFEVSDIIYVKVAKLATTNYPTVIGSHRDANLTTGVWEYYFENDTRGLDVYGGGTFNSTVIKPVSTAVIDEPVIGIMYLPNALNNTDKSVYFTLGKYRSYPSNVKFYRVIVYRYNATNLNIFMSFIPCYRKADGEIGFYEPVSETFLTNAGSGTFSKGSDIN